MSILPKSFSRLPSLYTDFNLITSDERLNKNKILLLRTYYFSLEWSKIILVLDDPNFELHSGFLRKWCPSQLWSFVAQPRKFAIHTCTRTFIFTEPESGLCLDLSPIERPSEVQELFGLQTFKFTAFICSVPNFSPHAPCPLIIDRKERLANYMIIIPHSVKGNGPVIV